MANRKQHSKSRDGCKQCKDRKVKLDTPNSLQENNSGDTPSLSATDSATVVSDCTLTSGRDQSARLREIYLMNWYTTEVYDSLSSSPDDSIVWQKLVPREAARFGFLADGLLAISSLHLATTLDGPPHDSYVQAALQYQSSALASLKSAIFNIDDVNIHAVFGLSAIMIVVPLALCCIGGSHAAASDPPSVVLLSVCELLRGSVAVMRSAETAMHDGMWRRMLLVDEIDPSVRCGEEVQQATKNLRARATFVSRFVGQGRREVYETGISLLESLFTRMARQRHLGAVFAWPVIVDAKLIELFQQNDPMAQLIWTHYGVLTLGFHSRWWGSGFGLRLINELCCSLEAVDQEWNEWTVWPRRCAERLQSNGQLPRYD
ncbi:hypothetical protein QQS21_005460 [Conoideocrella luteorostrata]|uniref:Uncharacterized protein n=1 Tax=Conoideocrella luteorostrata TaxID=1105319 RepID=A0AAJ0FUH4_9HYPO|nr:hypothetical protein QQS21_005460 [Conoideocrella luteorostrata]